MWTRDLVLALVAVLCMFMNIPALMVVAPQAAERASPGSGLAGVVTALFSGATVVTELMMPTLLGRFAARQLFVVAVGLLAIGSLACAFAIGDAAALLALAVVRGLGFGAAVVAAAILVAELAPATRRGEAIGYLGLASSVPNVIGPAGGLWMLTVVGFEWVFALAGVAALVGAGVAWQVRTDTAALEGGAAPLWQVFRRRSLLAPVLALTVLSISYGGLVSFAPLALAATGLGSAPSFFLVYGIGRGVARWLSGSGSDRFGSRIISLHGLGLSVVGLLVLALSHAPLVVLAAALLYGAGTGMAQSATLVGLLQRAGRAEMRLVSTLWNLALDLGVSAGGASLALVASAQGYESVLRVLPLCAAAALMALVLGGSRADHEHAAKLR